MSARGQSHVGEPGGRVLDFGVEPVCLAQRDEVPNQRVVGVHVARVAVFSAIFSGRQPRHTCPNRIDLGFVYGYARRDDFFEDDLA